MASSRWPLRLMMVMVGGGMMVMMMSLLLLLAPQSSSAATPMRTVITIQDGTTRRQVVGYSAHHLLVESLASASARLGQPFSYQINNSIMTARVMFGSTDQHPGYWTITVNGTAITNLHNVAVQRDDTVIVVHHQLP